MHQLAAGGLAAAQRLGHFGIVGIEDLTLVVGYHADELRSAISVLDTDGFVSFVENPDYREGSSVSLWCARDVLRHGGDVVFMDADVLYHTDVLGRLVRSDVPNCLSYDRDIEPGDEPGRLHEQVVEEDRRVGEDDALGRRVADVALVPERLVLEPGPGVAADQPGEPRDPLREDRVPLVGHRRAPLLARPERLHQLGDLGVLQVADLGRDPLERARGHRAGSEEGGIGTVQASGRNSCHQGRF